MIPVRIQNIQMGALSADKMFQSLKHLPQNQQRIFEGEVQKQMEEAKSRTEAMERSEKSRIQDEKKENDNGHPEREEKQKQQAAPGVKRESENYIEKKENGTIKHLDVKI